METLKAALVCSAIVAGIVWVVVFICAQKRATVFAAVVTLVLSVSIAGVAWIQRHRLAMDMECINNLRTIDGCKRQWAFEHFNHFDSDSREWVTDYDAVYSNAVATEADIVMYNSRNHYPMPRCPRGGTYTIGRVADPPTCSYPGHVLK